MEKRRRDAEEVEQGEEEVLISEPEVYVPEESLPEDMLRELGAVTGEEEEVEEPVPAGTERRIVRQPVAEMTSRTVYRRIDVRKELELELELELEPEPEREAVDEEVVAEPRTSEVVFEEKLP